MFCDVEDDTLRPNPAVIDVWIHFSDGKDKPFSIRCDYHLAGESEDDFKWVSDRFENTLYFVNADNAIQHMLENYLDDSHTIHSIYVEKDWDWLCVHKNIQDPRQSFRHGYGKGLTY